jgi:hypothetical protein
MEPRSPYESCRPHTEVIPAAFCLRMGSSIEGRFAILTGKQWSYGFCTITRLRRGDRPEDEHPGPGLIDGTRVAAPSG